MVSIVVDNEDHTDLMGLADEDEPLGEEEPLTDVAYDIVPNPNADAIDLSDLRGVASGDNNHNHNTHKNMPSQQALLDAGYSSETELEGLAEILPDVKTRRSRNHHHDSGGGMTADNVNMPEDGGEGGGGGGHAAERKMSLEASTHARRLSNDSGMDVPRNESMRVTNDYDTAEDLSGMPTPTHPVSGGVARATGGDGGSSVRLDDDTTLDDYPESEQLEHSASGGGEKAVPKEFLNHGSSVQSISTATQTHEVRMPMYLPTFKPATGCTNASDFIVRCFVARLRSGITVVKHGRSRWCKSRLRVLHIHPDGRSLSWKPAEGEPNSSKRPPKLDLSTCLEVRHAWSPDPQNPMYTGTPILRQKCEAANAHKSFALIFKHRTVDITAVTADQCKVLMEGFSALCFRLQVANLASRGAKKPPHARPMPEEDGISTTASATLTNSSTPRGR